MRPPKYFKTFAMFTEAAKTNLESLSDFTLKYPKKLKLNGSKGELCYKFVCRYLLECFGYNIPLSKVNGTTNKFTSIDNSLKLEMNDILKKFNITVKSTIFLEVLDELLKYVHNNMLKNTNFLDEDKNKIIKDLMIKVNKTYWLVQKNDIVNGADWTKTVPIYLSVNNMGDIRTDNPKIGDVCQVWWEDNWSKVYENDEDYTYLMTSKYLGEYGYDSGYTGHSAIITKINTDGSIGFYGSGEGGGVHGFNLTENTTDSFGKIKYKENIIFFDGAKKLLNIYFSTPTPITKI